MPTQPRGYRTGMLCSGCIRILPQWREFQGLRHLPQLFLPIARPYQQSTISRAILKSNRETIMSRQTGSSNTTMPGAPVPVVQTFSISSGRPDLSLQSLRYDRLPGFRSGSASRVRLEGNRFNATGQTVLHGLNVSGEASLFKGNYFAGDEILHSGVSVAATGGGRTTFRRLPRGSIFAGDNSSDEDQAAIVAPPIRRSMTIKGVR